MTDIRYYYKIEKITHRPSDQDIITLIKDIRDPDIERGRIVASQIYIQELCELQGKYSPESYDAYNLRKGVGYNIQLVLLDSLNLGEEYLVESTMEKHLDIVKSNKVIEQRIFFNLGLDDSILKI